MLCRTGFLSTTVYVHFGWTVLYLSTAVDWAIIVCSSNLCMSRLTAAHVTPKTDSIEAVISNSKPHFFGFDHHTRFESWAHSVCQNCGKKNISETSAAKSPYQRHVLRPRSTIYHLLPLKQHYSVWSTPPLMYFAVMSRCEGSHRCWKLKKNIYRSLCCRELQMKNGEV